ncbi:MAG: hypothetical protein KBT48_02310 [Firmicutes bacterium]|nr:hypothetical protein [Bacillota bacterium]
MIFIIIGLLGAILMFCGDMLFYYTPQDVDRTKNVIDAVIEVMKDLPKKRVEVGGLIGPVAAFLYCIGFYHIIEITNEAWKICAFVAFFSLCLGIIAGGAYHSHFAYFGLLGQDKFKESLDIVLNYFSKLAFIMYMGEGIGFLLLFLLILTGNTTLPRFLCILSPGILFLLKPIVRKLPRGIRAIVSGGWTNLISVIYYTAILLILL